MRLIPFMAITLSVVTYQVGFSAETTAKESLGNALEEAGVKAKDLTKLAQEKVQAGAEQAKSKAKDLSKAAAEKLNTGATQAKAKAEDLTKLATKKLNAGAAEAKNIANDLSGKAAQTLKEGQDKLQMLLDFGDEKSLNEAKTYVLTKLKGVPQSDAVADLLKRGVKGLGPWIEKKKMEAGSTLKMKMAYYSRYVDEPAIANTLKKWLNEDKDPLVQEYCARALGYQSSEGVVEALKAKAGQSDLSKYVKSALDSSLALLEPKTITPEPTVAPALPPLGK